MEEIKLDSKDFAILEALMQNAKQSVFQLAKKTAIPPTTIHNRLRKLRESKVIKGYTILLDREKIGQSICALIFVYLDNNLLEASSKKSGLSKQLSEYPNVGEVFETAGGMDIIVKVYGKNIKEIADFVVSYIREVKGVIKTETIIVFSERKRIEH